MQLADIERLLLAAKAVISHTDYIIIGSLSVLGAFPEAPPSMLRSVDVDLYPRDDAGRAGELYEHLGEKSRFRAQHGYYADPVSPALPTLPDGWVDRLISVHFESGVTAWFLHPNDAAISKYARCQRRDRRWIRAGVRAGILSLPSIEYWLREGTVLSTEDLARAKAAIARDRKLLRASKRPR